MANRIRTTLLAALTAALVFAGASTTLAGEVEHDVIQEALYAAIETPLDETPGDEMFAHSENIFDIWLDTEYGSYCEQYAASAYLIVSNWTSFAYANEQDPDNETGDLLRAAALAQGQMPLIDQIEAVARRCLNEE